MAPRMLQTCRSPSVWSVPPQQKMSPYSSRSVLFFFFFNDTATTEIYTLSLHDALPICSRSVICWRKRAGTSRPWTLRSEEHTSELQSPCNLVCRLLLEKKKRHDITSTSALRRRGVALTSWLSTQW